MPEEKKHFHEDLDVIIIGAGPAGMSAGIYTARKKLKTLVLSKDVGGQTAISAEIENYLGYQTANGAELSAKFQEHVEKFDCIDIEVGEDKLVKEISGKPGDFLVETKAGEKFKSKVIIIASGKNPRHMGVPGEIDFTGKGLTYCATCDAPLFKDKTVCVVGGGNSALDAAWQLTTIATKVYVLVRDAAFNTNADKVLFEKVEKAKNVEIKYQTSITEVVGEQLVTGVKIINKETNEDGELEVQGVFVEIGSVPSIDYLKEGQMNLNQWNEIVIDKHHQTSIDGIFAAGDVTDVPGKQVIIAAGEGALAAIAASTYLARNKLVVVSSDAYGG
ncbi:hypothetical protein CL634_04310 [bacterium]|nr:hypothetical protein [bacterium]|tara:strand:+ start:619 stop:1614 length:996 start_codon:yes stop_codon:yes gene_type:complete